MRVKEIKDVYITPPALLIADIGAEQAELVYRIVRLDLWLAVANDVEYFLLAHGVSSTTKPRVLQSLRLFPGPCRQRTGSIPVFEFRTVGPCLSGQKKLERVHK